jgi:coatomer subunit epsilon
MANIPGNEAQIQPLLQQLQSMLGDPAPGLQLTAANVLLQAGMKKEALACVHEGTTLEHLSVCVQIYIMIDRLDLAAQALAQMRRKDEDSMLTQVSGVHVALATGSSAAADAIHTLNQLSEQYGPSPFLLNLMACAYLQSGKYDEADSKLEQARVEFQATDVDTLANSIVAMQYQSKPTDDLINQLKTQYPNHFLSVGLDIVQGAFDRESIKYRV